MVDIPIKTANYKILRRGNGNSYQFICALSNAVLHTTQPVNGNTLEEEVLLAWEEGKNYFNHCHKCGRWVSDVMYNPDVCECVDCVPWEENPRYCSQCGVKIPMNTTFCSECGTRLRYREVWK